MNILEMKGIYRAYHDNLDVLKGVDLVLQPGEVVGLLGRNGAGKTTLLRIAMGLIDAHEGSRRVFGMGYETHAVEIKQRIGYVSENQALPEFMAVEDVIAIHRSLFPTWDRDLETKLARRFHIPERAKVSELSKGQARQVAVLCAVAHRPEFLILDEPAGGLDPAARREFLEVAIETLLDGGSTILFSSHHMQDVERIAERVVMLHDGRVMLDSELDSLREGLSLAVLPSEAGVGLESLRALDACWSAREHSGELRGVFRGAPDLLQASLALELGVESIATQRLGLEDLFIEAVEGQPA